MSFESLLIHTCNVSRYSEGAVDAYGQPAQTWATVYTALPCRLIPSGGREVKRDLQVVISDWTLHLAADVTITEKDRIVVDNISYEVLLVKLRNDSATSHHLELILQKVV
jgi:hypothetical protein